ncbi:hypothetical protein [Mesobacillus selenatarsenatis]|uniref:hypothetical protein n=1 Tax=Mesobacillus selenatarsenatis TaxID=388741 RepID=UPI0005AA37E6|nr:hypothetical protein [Mesobacillus selenatarsenatis]
MVFAVVIIIFVIAILNNKGISIGNYNSLKILLVLVMLGILIRVNFKFVEYDYFLKETVEPIVSIILIYIIVALLNRNGFLDKLKLNDFVGVILVVGGFAVLIAIIVI